MLVILAEISGKILRVGVGRGEAPLPGVVGENLQGLWEAAFF